MHHRGGGDDAVIHILMAAQSLDDSMKENSQGRVGMVISLVGSVNKFIKIGALYKQKINKQKLLW